MGAANNKQWAVLCDLIERIDLKDDPRFASNGDRVANRDELAEILNEIFSKRDADDWLAGLMKAGLPCGPINTVKDVFEHPQAQARQLSLESQHPTAGAVRLTGFPYKLSQTPAEVHRPPPLLGEHNHEVLEELQLNQLTTVGVSKGEGRKPGLETLHLSTARGEANINAGADLSAKGASFILPTDSPALHLVQQIRDEAHRFAITGHRQRRQKARNRSPLEEIPGLGPKRRQTLLKQFGGLQEVARAGIDDLSRINGISRELAERIYNAFHADGA